MICAQTARVPPLHTARFHISLKIHQLDTLPVLLLYLQFTCHLSCTDFGLLLAQTCAASGTTLPGGVNKVTGSAACTKVVICPPTVAQRLIKICCSDICSVFLVCTKGPMTCNPTYVVRSGIVQLSVSYSSFVKAAGGYNADSTQAPSMSVVHLSVHGREPAWHSQRKTRRLAARGWGGSDGV